MSRVRSLCGLLAAALVVLTGLAGPASAWSPAVRTAVLARHAAAWTPAKLAVAPRVWWNGDAAVFSGSNLSAFPDSGSEGGAATIGGTPTKATLNGRNGVIFDAGGETLSQTIGAWNTGKLAVFSVLKRYAGGGGSSGLFHVGGVQPTGSISFQPNNDGADGLYFIGNGYSGGGNPGIEGSTVTTPAIGTAARLVGAQLGTTLGFRVDGVDVIGQLSAGEKVAAAVPSYSAQAWTFGESWAGGSEVFNGEQFQLLLFDYFPTAAEWEKLEGWAAWRYGLQANLASGHPYKNGPPMVLNLLALPLAVRRRPTAANDNAEPLREAA